MSTGSSADDLARVPDGLGFFVVGSERSGTTMLRAILDSHPDLAVPPESYFFLPLVRNRSAFEIGSSVAVDNLVGYLERNPSFREWGLSVEDVRRAWDPPPVDVPEALRRLYGCYSAERAAMHVGDKTPHHVRVMPEIAEAFPEARFVHLIRDGRDVAASLSGVHFGPSSFAEAAATWRENVRIGHDAGPSLGSRRYLEVRYEALVADPAAELVGICSFLGVAYSPAMVRYHERADEILSGLRHDAHLQGVRRPPSADRDWRRDLTHHQIELFEAIAGDLAAELGYPLVTTGRGRRLIRLERSAYEGWWAAKRAVLRRRKQVARRVRTRPVVEAARGAHPG